MESWELALYVAASFMAVGSLISLMHYHQQTYSAQKMAELDAEIAEKRALQKKTQKTEAARKTA